MMVSIDIDNYTHRERERERFESGGESLMVLFVFVLYARYVPKLVGR